MSLNNIELGDLIVSELYRDSLLATEAKPGTGPSAKAIPPSQSAPRPPAGNAPASGSPIAPSPGAGAPASPITRTSDPIPPAPETKSPASSPLVSNPAASAPGTGSPGTSAPATPASGTGSPAAPTPGTTAPGYKFLGNNRREITIIVQSPGSAFLPDDQLAFLTRMLEACRMNMGDVAIVNQATAPVNITVLKQQLHPTIILLFGMEPVDIKLPMNFPVFKIQAYDACTYLSAPSLDDLVRPGDENKLLKSKLWMCLKSIFEI